MQSNDSLKLKPKTTFTGPTLNFDFPAVHVGIAEYEEGPTGCTVFYFPKDVQTAVPPPLPPATPPPPSSSPTKS